MKIKNCLILLVGVVASVSACSFMTPHQKSNNANDSGNATVYYLTRLYLDQAHQNSHSEEPIPTVLKFDYKAMKTYNLISDNLLGGYSQMYGYHEYSLFEHSKLTVAVEYEDGIMTQYYLEFDDPNITATMKKETAPATINGEEGTLPNTSNKEHSSAGVLDLGFKFSIDEVSIKPDCLFPDTYFYCEYNYALENNYKIQDYH